VPDRVMNPFTCATTALSGFRGVLQHLTERHLSLPTPCSEYTVEDVAEHVARSMTLLASVAGGGCEATVGSLDERISAAAMAALEAWRRRGVDGSVNIGRSVYPAHLALEIVPLELLVHGWDIAQGIGATLDVPSEIAEHVLSRARELVTADKRGKSFAAEVAVAPDAPPLERLIAFTGRVP
jgi:uncharacterized protein (TIGR03086 family)